MAKVKKKTTKKKTTKKSTKKKKSKIVVNEADKVFKDTDHDGVEKTIEVDQKKPNIRYEKYQRTRFLRRPPTRKSIPYDPSLNKEIVEWIDDGRTIKSWLEFKGIVSKTFYEWLQRHPQLKFDVKMAQASQGHKWKDSYIDDCELAIEGGLTLSEFSKQMNIPINVIANWEDFIPEFRPSKLRTKYGRPSKYNKSFCDTLIEKMSEGRSVPYFCAEINIGENTFKEWLDKHSEFAAAYKLGKVKCQRYYENLAEAHITGDRFDTKKHGEFMQKADANFLRFMMACRLKDYQQTQKIEDVSEKKEVATLDLSKLNIEELKTFRSLMDKIEPDNSNG